MKASNWVLSIVSCLFVSVVSFAETTDFLHKHRLEKRYNIFFPINSSTIEEDFYSNARTIETLRQDIENTFAKGLITPSASDSIYIISTSSPDGPRELNRNLAKMRAESTSRFLQQLLPEFSQSNIIVEYIEENWDGLRQILRADLDFPQRDEMLRIIESTLSADDKERLLRGYTEGWEYFVNNHIYALRNSSITLIVLGIRDEFATDRALEGAEDLSSIPVSEIPHSDIAFKTSEIASDRRRKVAAVRTNLLSPLTNIGVEVCLNNRWSLEADYYFPWVPRNKDHQDAVQMLAWGLTGRYWFGKDRTYQKRLLGHSVGLGAYMGYYDFEHDYTGHQGEFASVCLDYMYALPIFRNRMHLEFTLGVGYLYSYARPYDVFELGGKGFREGYTKNIHWVGPLKAGVSLVVPIYMTKK